MAATLVIASASPYVRPIILVYRDVLYTNYEYSLQAAGYIR